MGLIEFVRNYDDLSTDMGYQFKFYCDKCGNGWVSPFQTSKLGAAGSILRAAGGLFGGVFGQAAHGEYEIRRATQGKAHDSALQTAVEEAKKNFKKCTRCGHWVCPESCWNAEKGLCEDCAPDLAEESAAAQAQVAKDQVFDKARATDLVKDVDIVSNVNVQCPQCRAKVAGGKFCPDCGAPMSPKIQCKKCGTEMKPGAKFCPECGQKMA
ncbi:MAG: zinc ribbon domain-containing protein [Planctomycetes bacterium]|nr:zinc ribbon domain-containing protein [Planctomycetota bacterium]